MYCLQCFCSKKILNKNKTDCIVIYGQQTIKVPGKDEKNTFQNHRKHLPVPFVIYADFEAITELQGCSPNDNKSFSDAYIKAYRLQLGL